MSTQEKSKGPAAGGRISPEEIQRQAGHFSEESITRHLLDAIPSVLVILNDQRQIVYANKSLFDMAGIREQHLVHGLRPGEVLDCVHSHAAEEGCGTGLSCRNCGALMSILESSAGREETREVRLTRRRGNGMEALDLKVWATPFDFREERFTVFALSDISHQKRRHALERIFFHDILNVLGSVRGFAELLREEDLEDRREIFALIHAAVEQTIEEIEAQRILAAAESKGLQVSPERIGALSFLERLLEIYRHHQVAQGRNLVLEPGCPDGGLLTDRVLLGRILGNMIKNALEASKPGETVTIGFSPTKDGGEFRVHNPGTIPSGIQAQIFQRSFSTRGEGRGLGTYSMRLLSEYLRGDVSFSSDPGAGTCFRIRIPREYLPID